MATFNFSDFTEKLRIALNDRASVMKYDVMQSTGSLHDKEDVYKVIDRTLDDTLQDIIVDVFLNSKTSTDDSEQQLYTRQMIESAFLKVHFEEFVEVDKSSAEMSMSYDNCVELDNVDFEVDSDSIFDDFEQKLDAEYSKNKSQSNNQ